MAQSRQREAQLHMLMVMRFTRLQRVGLLQLQRAAMWNTSLWVVVAAAVITAAVAAVAAASAQAPDMS